MKYSAVISAPSLKLSCVSVMWCTKYGEVKGQKLSSEIMTTHFFSFNTLQLQLQTQWTTCITSSPSSHTKYPAKMSEIKQKSTVLRISRNIQIITEADKWILWWLVAGRSEMYVGAFHLVQIHAVLEKF